jgi:hypothetical protein
MVLRLVSGLGSGSGSIPPACSSGRRRSSSAV